MRKYKLDFDTCLKKIREARPCCQPNSGFEKQLREYQKTLGINWNDPNNIAILIDTIVNYLMYDINEGDLKISFLFKHNSDFLFVRECY